MGMATVGSLCRSVRVGEEIRCTSASDLATQRRGISSAQREAERYVARITRGIERMDREVYAKLAYRQRVLSLALQRQERWSKKLAENSAKLKEVARCIAATSNPHQLKLLQARRSRINETIHRNRGELSRATQAVRKAALAVNESEEAGRALGQVQQLA